jgi:hypothetical protein
MLPVLIADSGIDQFLITSTWSVTEFTGRHIVLSGALAGRHPGSNFPVVSAVALNTVPPVHLLKVSHIGIVFIHGGLLCVFGVLLC